MPLTGAIALFALSAPAAAAPPWTPPTTIGTPDDAGALLIGSSGAGIIATDDRIRGITRDGRLGPVRHTPHLLDVGVSRDHGIVLRRSADDRRATVSAVALGSGRIGRPQLVHRGTPADLALAVGTRGDVLVAVSTGTSGYDPDFADARVTMRWTRAADRTGWRSRALPGRADLLAIRVDPRGTAIVLLQRPAHRGHGYRVTARTLVLRTGRLGPERTLDTHVEESLVGSIATNGRGDAVLAWGSQDGGEEPDTPFVIRSAFRRRGTTSFTPATTLDTGGAVSGIGGSDNPSTALDDAGNATVAWTQAVGESTGMMAEITVPRAATSTGRYRLGAPQDLLTSGSVADVATAGRTTLVAVVGATTPFDPDARGVEENPRPTVGGVLVRDGVGPLGPVEPFALPDPGDIYALQVDGSPAGFRAVWAADRDGALRTTTRPLR